MAGAEVVSFRCVNMVFQKSSHEEIHSYVASAVESIENEVRKRVSSYVPNCEWDINIVTLRGGVARAAYVWLTSEPVVSMLLGLTHEGGVVASGPVSEGNSFEGLPLKDQLFMMDWHEIPTSQWSVFPLPDEVRCDKPPRISRARATIPDECFERGKLFCKTPLPDDYTNERIVSLFAPFNTNKKSVHVTRTPRGNVYVEFFTHTDSCFALMMRKKYYDAEKDIELSFDYALAKEPSSRRTKRR